VYNYIGLERTREAMHWQFGEMKFGEMKRNKSNWSNFGMLLCRAGLTASAELSCFTHLLHVPLYTRLQIFIELFPTLTKLCHTKRDHQVNFFYIALELKLLSLLTEQMMSLLTSCHVRHVC